MTEIISVRFRPGGKQYYFDPAGLTVAEGQSVIVETGKGLEYGTCVRRNTEVEDESVVLPLRPVVRLATEKDEKQVKENRGKEKDALRTCQQLVEHHGLDMKLVQVEYSFDGNKIIFFFTSDGRVDFRALVKDLAGIFRARIELRQIGVRDEARMLGGFGICGKPFCCAQFLDEFQPVSIKMAKTQNLSLNPTKISGTCGRLMCCLKYEQDTYESLIRSSPKPESFVDTPDGRGTVVEADILRQRVKVQMENDPNTINVFPNEEIAVLRNGKAKKNDPPIPADLAPISGNGKRKPRQEEAPVLEPIRFRYSTEQIVEETAPVVQPEPEEQKRESRPPRQRRRRGSRGEEGQEEKPEQPKSDQRPPRQHQRRNQQVGKPNHQEQPENRDARGEKQNQPRRENREPRLPRRPQPELAQAEAVQSGNGETQKPRNRNNHYRHRKPKAPQA